MPAGPPKQSSGPPRQGAGQGSRIQKSGKVQISRGDSVGATGNTLDSEWNKVQSSALPGELAPSEQGPPENSSSHHEEGRYLLDPGATKAPFLRSGPVGAPGKVDSMGGEIDFQQSRLRQTTGNLSVTPSW